MKCPRPLDSLWSLELDLENCLLRLFDYSMTSSTSCECRLHPALRPKTCFTIARYDLLMLPMGCVTCSPQNKGEKYHRNRYAKRRNPPPSWSIRPQLTNIHTKCALDTISFQFASPYSKQCQRKKYARHDGEKLRVLARFRRFFGVPDGDIILKLIVRSTPP